MVVLGGAGGDRSSPKSPSLPKPVASIPSAGGMKLGGKKQESTIYGVSVPSNLTSMSVDELPKELQFDSVLDLIQRPQAYRILLYGLHATGKTHFSLSMPGPIFVLDSEDRAHHIVTKFTENGKQKSIYVKVWKTFDELEIMTNVAIMYLNKIYETTGVRGTIVVDSVTREWSEVANKYCRDKYHVLDSTEATLDPMNDYKHINAMHYRWLDALFASGFNVCVTCKVGFEYEDRYTKGESKPKGQSELKHDFDYVIRTFKNERGMQGVIEKYSISGEEMQPIRNLDFPLFAKQMNAIKPNCGCRSIESIIKEVEAERIAEANIESDEQKPEADN